MSLLKHGEREKYIIMREFKDIIIIASAEKTDAAVDFVFNNVEAEDHVKLHIINCPEMAETFRGGDLYKLKLISDNETTIEVDEVDIKYNTVRRLAKMPDAIAKIIENKVYIYIDMPIIPAFDIIKCIAEDHSVQCAVIGAHSFESVKVVK